MESFSFFSSLMVVVLVFPYQFRVSANVVHHRTQKVERGTSGTFCGPSVCVCYVPFSSRVSLPTGYANTRKILKLLPSRVHNHFQAEGNEQS